MFLALCRLTQTAERLDLYRTELCSVEELLGSYVFKSYHVVALSEAMLELV